MRLRMYDPRVLDGLGSKPFTASPDCNSSRETLGDFALSELNLLSWIEETFDDTDVEICRRHLVNGESQASVARDLELNPGTVCRRTRGIRIELRIHVTSLTATRLLSSKSDCTVHPVTQRCREFSGVGLSLAGYEQVLDSAPTYDDIAAYLRSNESGLAIAAPVESPEPLYFGAWRGDYGRWHLDVTRIVSNYAVSMDHGAANGQQAVCDFDSGQVHPRRRAA